jgi:integration host factor subunit alpha
MPTTLTRARIVETLSTELQLPRDKSIRFLEYLIETMIDSLADREKLKIVSFGSFRVLKKSRRIGRNPKTGEDVIISSRRVVAFSSSSYLRKKVRFCKS